MKRESEKVAKLIAQIPEAYPVVKPIPLTSCFKVDEDGNNARYETSCIDDYVTAKKATPAVSDTESADTTTVFEFDVSDDVSEDDEPHPEL